MKFKVGDRVVVDNTANKRYPDRLAGLFGTIIIVDYNDPVLSYGVFFDKKIDGGDNLFGSCPDKHGYWLREEDIGWSVKSVGYLQNNFNIMDLKEKFVLAVTPEPQKSFRKADIVDCDNLITQEGQRIFLTWLLGKYADEFKKDVVDGLLKEEE